MKINTTVVLIVTIIIAVVLIIASRTCELKCTSCELFGQDASIRAQSGWIAGPKGMYGYDPIDQFAEQIDEMKAQKRSNRSRLGMMESRNLVDSPTGVIGPTEGYVEGNRPYVFDRHCNHQPDCLEGEQCLAGTCVPATIVADREGYTPPGGCKACMTTEEFEMSGN